MTRETKAAEDRHIGFRWLRWAARLEDESSADAVFRAVAARLAQRLGPSRSRHLRSHLPLGLREVWDEETRFARQGWADRADLVESVRARLGLRAEEDAEWLVSLVFAWLRQLAPEERDDISAALPEDLRELWQNARLEAPSWARLHLPLVESTGTEDVPTGYTLTVRRQLEDGSWVAEVSDSGGRTLAWWEDDERRAAVEEARAIALRSLERERVYHPEREASP